MASPDPLQDSVVGYPRLGAQMALRPETAMFRTFAALNAQNLLYFQAELTLLETDLKRQQTEDSADKTGVKSQYALNWYDLRESGENGQLDLMLKIRRTLKEYNKALMQASHILAFPEPDQWDISFIQNFLHTAEMGPLAMTGLDATTWGSISERKAWRPDLVAVCPRPKEDLFSNWVSEKAIVLFRGGGAVARLKNPSRIHGVVGYQDTTVLKITYWTTSILASLIPIASIVVLYSVHSMSARLAIIGAFNVLISICLSGFTNAKRSEVFAVTAALAAVQVVFVSQTTSGLGKEA